MATTSLIVLFNLKPGVSETDYEQFAKTLDIPTVKGLQSVEDFRLYKSFGIFGSDAPPPYRYFEIIDFGTVETLVADMGNEPKMAAIPAKFQEFTDNPIFILTNQIA
jgi:hypothetical protein